MEVAELFLLDDASKDIIYVGEEQAVYYYKLDLMDVEDLRVYEFVQQRCYHEMLYEDEGFVCGLELGVCEVEVVVYTMTEVVEGDLLWEEELDALVVEWEQTIDQKL